MKNSEKNQMLKEIAETVLLRNQTIKQYEKIQKNFSSVENLKQMNVAKQMRAKAFVLFVKINSYTFKELAMIDTISETINFHSN